MNLASKMALINKLDTKEEFEGRKKSLRSSNMSSSCHTINTKQFSQRYQDNAHRTDKLEPEVNAFSNGITSPGSQLAISRRTNTNVNKISSNLFPD